MLLAGYSEASMKKSNTDRYRKSTPPICQTNGDKIVRLEGSLMFPAGEKLSDAIQLAGGEVEKGESSGRVIIDFDRVTKMDGGAADGIVEGIQFTRSQYKNIDILLKDIKPSFLNRLRACGYEDSMCPGVEAEGICNE